MSKAAADLANREYTEASEIAFRNSTKWWSSHKGKGAELEIGDQKFVRLFEAAERAHVDLGDLRQWADAGETPNGWPVIAMQDSRKKKSMSLKSVNNRPMYIDERTVERIQRRYAYVGTGEEIWPIRKVHQSDHHFVGSDSSSDAILNGVESVKSWLQNIDRRYSCCGTLLAAFAEGNDPLGKPLCLVRDCITGERYLTDHSILLLHGAVAEKCAQVR